MGEKPPEANVFGGGKSNRNEAAHVDEDSTAAETLPEDRPGDEARTRFARSSDSESFAADGAGTDPTGMSPIGGAEPENRPGAGPEPHHLRPQGQADHDGALLSSPPETGGTSLERLFARHDLGLQTLAVDDALSRQLQELITARPTRSSIPGLVVDKQAIHIRLSRSSRRG